MLGITILVLLARSAAGALDEDLHAKYLTMPRHEFIEYFNKQNYSYKITDYGDDITTAFGASLDFSTIKNFPVKRHDSRAFEDLPPNFDSRQKWPHCETIQEIYDQGSCGSCWTFGTANTASDRTCIHKNVHVHLAEQDFECLQDNVCDGGNPGSAFMFWLLEGLVTQECKPYNITKLKESVCKLQCVNKERNYTDDKHYASKIYIMHNESSEHIKAELFNNGPVQAAFHVYSDFFDYKGGIYEHKYGDELGGHSVRIIGYGVENNIEYWLVANSWGYKWGENGHFRVKTFTKDLGFESYLVTGMPKK